ncbi:MAG TPA: hypothetical protein VLS53_06645 [Candidatus Dormibacteraeota bacterium]|nr:hypothetical protein [Candidatus Dormibacteraeota bacterium]
MKRASLPLIGRAFLAATFTITLGSGALLWSSHPRPAGPAEFLWIAALGMLAHAFPIRASRHQAYQVTLPFIIIAAALFSIPELAAFILLIHVAEQLRVRRPIYIQLFNFCDYFLSAAAAAVFFQRAVAVMPPSALSSVEAAMAAGCTFIVLNRVLLAGALWTARGLSPARCGLFRPELLAADLVIIWISGPMLVLTTQAGAWMVLVTAGPLCLARPALAAILMEPRRSTREVPANAA